MRENDVQRTYFDFPAAISPLKCSILPLISQPELIKKVYELSK
jgi:glycyl-tRNA synthetase (class II)